MIKRIEGDDEVIFTTEDGGFLWKRYNRRGELVEKCKYLMDRLSDVRRLHPAAQVIRDIPVIGR
jgi:hypothetical protein